MGPKSPIFDISIEPKPDVVIEKPNPSPKSVKKDINVSNNGINHKVQTDIISVPPNIPPSPVKSDTPTNTQYDTIVTQLETIVRRMDDFDRRLKLLEGPSVTNQTRESIIEDVVNVLNDDLQF
ncbi:unnamed protein product [Rotaria sp. Silwood2]|nr:unnamed protein product [Rotaria sp. Silwood2]